MTTCYVNLCGGLGNQLFQVAAGYSYAKKYNKELIIDDSSWTASQGSHPRIFKDTIFRNFKYGITPTSNITSYHEINCKFNDITSFLKMY